MPDETGRTCFSSAPITASARGSRGLGACGWQLSSERGFEGNARPTETNVKVDVRKAFPAVDSMTRDGPAVHVEGEVIPPKAPKPPNRRRRERKKVSSGARTTA